MVARDEITLQQLPGAALRTTLLIILAGISYALGINANLRAMRHLAPGVKPKDVAGPRLRGDEEMNRLASLYTPRGLQLRRLGMAFLLVCAMAAIFLVINLVSLMPSIWHTNVGTDTNQVLLQVAQNKPSIFLMWVAALVLAWLGFMGARFRPLLAAPVLALVMIWSYELTGGFPGQHREIIGTATERSYVLQVWLACTIALFVTGQGMRSWMVRSKNRPRTP